MDDSSPIDARRTLWIVGLLIATIGVFLVLWLPNSKPWWKMEDFGCPDGYFRVDGGQALRVDGGCGGLSPFGVVLRLKPGDTVDVHMLEFPPVTTSDSAVMKQINALSDPSSKHFKAIANGKAVLSTNTTKSRCGGPGSASPSGEDSSPKQCPVLVVTVATP